MSSNLDLANQFLIAMPQLDDPNFHHTVTYICEHSEDGAMGIVVNRPIDLSLGDVLKHMALETQSKKAAESPVYFGGPVQKERGFVIHSPSGDWDSMHQVNNQIAVTTSRDILEAIANDQGPDDTLIALGYAGWGPGQLEEEISQNAWLTVPFDHRILFQTPSHRRWEAAAGLIGVDIHHMSDEVGHA